MFVVLGFDFCWFSEEDRKWFMEAMQAQSVDVVKRMKEITLVMKTPEDVLEAQGVTPADIQGKAILWRDLRRVAFDRVSFLTKGKL